MIPDIPLDHPAFNGPRVEAKRVVAQIASHHGVSFSDIVGPRRFAKMTTARMEACWRVARDFPTISLKQIGCIVRKDHTTVIHAVRVVNERTGENVRGLGVVSQKRRAQCRRSARVSYAEARS